MVKPLLVIGNKNYSSWSLRAWLVARKAGLDFEEKRIPLDTPEFEANIETYSPSRRVPVLRDGDLLIWDSLAIAEYLNETHANHTLWPENPQTRAIARSITAEMHSGFATLRQSLPMNIRARDRHVSSTPALEQDITRVTTLWRECREQYGSTGPWLFGAFSIADAFYAPVVFRFVTYGVSLGTVEQTYAETVQGDRDIEAWVQAANAEVETIPGEEVG
ncbi:MULTISPECIES: glutathione S-transferase family protein [unclassified Leptolyngbya]|uniref:glutathione S-transferase family protein n=1 Tax=unclassified Leptolyngbya TaxID=2650499 RepID=UPI001687BCA3|nr:MULTISPECIES: glutathione S-transferase family protein [unclassified Leptolyngbya]MBD1912732.1 glutathione S-transferase family protein [Leptolyngbya sp. FACHB-8]MBD2155754.1 glutathione S-transferase family protein [Leptolyngbya sp. FACHB-16]